MILKREELEQVVAAEVYAPTFVPLHVNEIQEYKGNLQVTEDSYNIGVKTHVDQYDDEWRLREGTYHVNFEEYIGTIDPNYIPVIFPSSNALSVGVESSVRYVTDTSLWTLLRVNKSVNLADDAVVALLVIYDNRRDVEYLTANGNLEEEHEIAHGEGEDITVEF